MASFNAGERGRQTAQQPAATGGSQAPRGRTLEQERAKKAWDWVKEAEKLGASSARYGTLARKLPGYLKVSGLGQTMAFLFSKAKGGDKGAEGLLFRQLGHHLLPNSGKNLMDGLLDFSPVQYRQATREAVAIAEWLKRFAAGALGEER